MRKTGWIGLASLLYCLKVSAEIDFLIFPELVGSLSENTRPDAGDTDFDLFPAADFFFSARYRRSRIMAEYFLSKDEQQLERLQADWNFTENTRFGLGRVHNFLGYWNTEFHHGSFLETSINRPAAVEFEDDGGIVPSHITGFMLETGHALHDSQLRYDLAFGLVPMLKKGKLEAFDILDPEPEDHNLGGSFRISYRPNATYGNELGVFSGVANIASEWNDFRRIIQYQFGAFVNWEFDNVRIISSVFYLPNKIRRVSGLSHDTVISAYLQTEYAFHEDWRIYARYEKTADVDELGEALPELVEQWALGGVRFDIGENNALKLEMGHKQQINETNFQVQIQWSAVFP